MSHKFTFSGIVQLQWALFFLQSIYNGDGVHPKDVDLCIETIQDFLIDEYAEMSEESVVYGATNISQFLPREENTSFSPNYSQMIDKCPNYALGNKDSMVIDRDLLDEFENIKTVVGLSPTLNLQSKPSRNETISVLKDWKKEQIDKIEESFRTLHTVEDMMKNVDKNSFEGYTDISQFIQN